MAFIRSGYKVCWLASSSALFFYSANRPITAAKAKQKAI